MANPLYGFNPNSYGGDGDYSSLYPSASIGDYNSTNSSLLGSSRYLGSNPLVSSSSSTLSRYSSVSDRDPSIVFSHADALSGGYSVDSRTPAGGGTGLAVPTHRMTSWPGPPSVEIRASRNPLFAGYKRPSSESKGFDSLALYHQTGLGAHNYTGHTEAWLYTDPSAKRPRFEYATNLPTYPQRQGEKDCAHYMQTRTCKFGDSCKFDHPIWVPEGGIPEWQEVPLDATNEILPERPGQPDCPYFLKTQRCKFGMRCKFNHPKDKVGPVGTLETTDVSILPQRPSELLCAFYAKTGKCKFGATCKFHHPTDLLIPLAQGNGNSVQKEVVKHETAAQLNLVMSPFAPALVQNSKGLPVRQGEVDCPFYIKTGSCKYGPTCRYNHPNRNAMNLTSVGAALITSPGTHFNIGFINPAASILQTVDPRVNQSVLGVVQTVYPQRPGEIECDFYMKTGECKFRERCKYHHPTGRTAPTSAVEVKLTLAGLPRREGSVKCPYYMKTGACKYGATCKFDHPPPGEVMAMATTTQGITTTTSSVGGENA